jgi:hypothetical protein
MEVCTIYLRPWLLVILLYLKGVESVMLSTSAQVEG